MRPLLLITLWLTASFTHAESPIRPGDRIAIVGNTFADQLRIHGYLETLLHQQSALSLRNLGWAGDTLTDRDRPTGFPTEESTLTEHQTDVIIACFGMGESFDGETGIEGFKTDLKTFLASHAGKKYNGESPVRLVLVSPIAHEDLGKRSPQREKRNRELAAYTDAMKSVAEEEKLPFVDLYQPSLLIMNEQTGPNLTTNGITLNQFGYWALSHSFYQQLTGEPRQPWTLEINTATNTGTATGVELSNIAIETNISFTVTEQTPASLAPPTEWELSALLHSQRDSLTILNLAPGRYSLLVDGEEIITATDEDWANGVPIDNTPSHHEAEALRLAINDKNLQFTYSWKALNQVHIVGERKSSPSGRALPAEVLAFAKLAKEREAELTNLLPPLPRKRQWQLTPAKNKLP